VPDSPAAKAGVKTGDAIVSINDQPATSARAVTRQISVTEPGTDLKLGLLRSGERLEVHAIAGVRPTPAPK
jgi:serine protease DegQ